jgi:FkbM family methyltransferase
MLHKCATALRLLFTDFHVFHIRWRENLGRFRLRWTPQSFVYRMSGSRLVCHPQCEDSVRHYLGDVWDEWEAVCLRRWLQPGDVFLDIGANVGFYSFTAAPHVGPTGAVYAFEPSSRLVTLLQSTVELLDLRTVHIMPLAIADRCGTLAFYESDNLTDTGAQSLLPDGTHATSRETRVEASTLEQIATRLPAAPAAVKIDIEGAECQALAATPASWLGPAGPLWIVEINPEALHRFQSSPGNLQDRFPEASFHRWVLPKYPRSPQTSCAPRPLTPAETWTDSVYYNLVAIPRDAPPVRQTRLGSLLPLP